jgi:hypothetical protein
MSTFLDTNDLVLLTGRKTKSKQVAALRRMGIQFFVNACGKPVVPISAIDGRREEKKFMPQWNPTE